MCKAKGRTELKNEVQQEEHTTHTDYQRILVYSKCRQRETVEHFHTKLARHIWAHFLPSVCRTYVHTHIHILQIQNPATIS